MTPLKNIFLLTAFSLLMSSTKPSPTSKSQEWDCSPEESSRSCEGTLCTLTCSDGQKMMVSLQCEEEQLIVNDDNEVFCSPDALVADEAKFLGPLLAVAMDAFRGIAFWSSY